MKKQLTHHYQDKFDASFVRTTDIDLINREVDELVKDPHGYKTLVVDGITSYWDLLQDKHLKRLRVKKGKSDYVFMPGDFKLLKADLKAFINKLMALDMNIVMTARVKPEYADQGEFMKVIGVQPDAPKDVP